MSPSPVDSPATEPSRSARLRRWAPPVAAAAIAFVAVLCQLDPGGADPGMPQGPGLTVDEGFYTQQGVYLAAARHFGLALLDPRTLGEIFDTDAGYMADHPPLAKLWLGLWHDLAWWAHAPESPGGFFSVARARVGSAAAFALTVGLLVLCGTRWYGLPTGLAAGASLILMPRVFGHAHIASLETVTNLFFTACLCGVAAWWNPRVTTFKRPALCGLLFGLALLCKIQGALLGPTVAVWALYHAWREHGWKEGWRAIGPVAVFGGVGLCVFFVGWPYLWLNPSEHGAAFLGTITDRLPIRNYYLGQVWNGEEFDPTPWHYPLVMTLATVPVGITALALYGAWRGGIWGGVRGEEGGVRREKLGTAGSSPLPPPSSPLTLFTAAVLVPLALVSTRGESLYDGVRLWLVIFPPLALLAGRGAGLLFERLKDWRPKLAVPAVVGLLAVQGVNVVWMSPVWLSSYSAVVGGLWGADRLGFERNYWGDAVTRDLLNAADRQAHTNAPFFVAPALHQFADDDRAAASPAVRRRNDTWEMLSPLEQADGLGGDSPSGLAFGFHELDVFGTIRFARRAYWQAIAEPYTPPYETLLIDRPARFLPGRLVMRRQGVVLAVAPVDAEVPRPTEAEWGAMRLRAAATGAPPP
ncbi:ArnT family glycosyltransferase [Alienimonas californiensis]|uniref:Uncharacterized protein n=1 Tax=Alienimonas californiensis TaxID=2527989 RepID=A0A517PFE3_9PLAN|nr:glycosyltransferase family 39 protein [Alienimonas californiensis]QDT18092.1 hypothetical protein CA12_42310 [Alienimonas californiensis]